MGVVWSQSHSNEMGWVFNIYFFWRRFYLFFMTINFCGWGTDLDFNRGGGFVEDCAGIMGGTKGKTVWCAFFAAAMMTMVATETIVRFSQWHGKLKMVSNQHIVNTKVSWTHTTITNLLGRFLFINCECYFKHMMLKYMNRDAHCCPDKIHLRDEINKNSGCSRWYMAAKIMKASWHRNAFRISGPLWGETAHHRGFSRQFPGITSQSASNTELCCFRLVFETPLSSWDESIMT